MKAEEELKALKKPADYHFQSIGVLPPTKRRLRKLAKRLHLPIYQFVDLLVSEFEDDLHDTKTRRQNEEIDEKDKQIFQEFRKLRY